MRRDLIVASFALALTLSFGTTAVRAAAAVTGAAAQEAGGAISQCTQTKQGQPLIDCVGDAMAGLASAIDRGDIPKLAPQVVQLAGQAATIRGKPKAPALGVLNRVLSVARGFAAKSSGEGQQAYNNVAGAFARAIAAVERRG